MKAKLIVLFCFIALGVQAQKVHWYSMSEALALQASSEQPKKLFIDVYTDWCGPCKMLEKNTFQNPDVAEYLNTHFYPVKFNAEGNDEFVYKGKSFANPNYRPSSRGRNSRHQFCRKFNISGYPTMLFLDEGANKILPLSGYYSPRELEIYLKYVATDDYIKINTQESFKQYKQNFKSTFKD